MDYPFNKKIIHWFAIFKTHYQFNSERHTTLKREQVFWLDCLLERLLVTQSAHGQSDPRAVRHQCCSGVLDTAHLLMHPCIREPHSPLHICVCVKERERERERERKREREREREREKERERERAELWPTHCQHSLLLSRREGEICPAPQRWTLENEYKPVIQLNHTKDLCGECQLKACYFRTFAVCKVV